MKKTAFITFFLACFAFHQGHAQIVKSAGIKAGVFLSKQDWTYTKDGMSVEKDYRTGMNLALNLELFNHRYFSMVSEFGYLQKGFKENIWQTTAQSPEVGVNKTFDTRFDFLFFSPQLKFRKAIDNFVPYVFVGPRLDFYLSYTSDFDLSDIENDINKTGFGLNYGLGISYMLNQIGISIEFANYYDLTNVIKLEPTQNNTGVEVLNNAFAIDIGIAYTL